MHSTASDLTLPSLTSDDRERLLSQVHLHSLYELFATLPDPRRKQGQRYELAFLLTCLVAALLCNCNSTLALGQWCADQRPLLQELFGPRRFLSPSDSLYRKLLPRLQAEQLEWMLADWLRCTLRASDDDPVALDGKTVRGAKADEERAPHLLSDLARIRARKFSCKCVWMRRPTRFPSPNSCCPACPSRGASTPPMPCIPRSPFSKAFLTWVEMSC